MNHGDKPTGHVRFAVLGPVRAWRDAEPLDLGPPQQRAMLAVLLLRQGHRATADELVDAIWGDAPPPRAVGALRTYAFRLRRILEEPHSRPRLLMSAGDGYALHVHAGCLDAEVFEDRVRAGEKARADGDPAAAARLLREALDLWDGTPLAGVPGPFAEAQRARLDERRVSVQEIRFELELEAGRHAEIVGELTALSAEHTLRERLRGLLMLALYRCGRQAEALAVFADGRRILAEELGIDPEPELQALYQRILNADPTLTAPSTPTTHTTQAARPLPRPAQLPADVADFTGRDAVVAHLIEAVRAPGASAVAISAVSGIGGVGKTTTAVHVAHAVRDDFPDGQLYVDLRGVGDRPYDPGAVLSSFLRSLGVADAAIPPGIEERAALYRSTLADRRVLVLLDNAKDGEQIRQLLPGSPTCAVIATSRARLAELPGARLVELDVLDPREALALFARIVGEDKVAADRQSAMAVVARCGCLPLAVRIVASRLVTRPGWSIATLADRLADERRRLAELRVGDLTVEATFRLGYNQLGDDQARAFRLLAVPDGADISLPAAAAVLDLDEPSAEDLLESLVDAAMLESPAPGRYRFHDLLRLFARRRSTDADTAADRTAALGRLLDHYLATTRNAYQVVQPGHPVPDVMADTASAGRSFSGMEAVHQWVIDELANVLAVLHQAAHDPDAPIAVAADVVLGLEPLVEVGFHWRALEPAARAVAEAAGRAGDRRAEARALSQLVSALLETRQLDEAAALAHRTAALCRESGDVVVLFGVLIASAMIAIRQEDYEGAIAHYDEAIAAVRGRSNPLPEAHARMSAAFALSALGRSAEAVTACERSLEIFHEYGDDRGQAHTLYQRGLAQRGLGRLDDALDSFAESLLVCRGIGLRVWEAYCLFRMADVHLAAGRLAEAMSFAEQSAALSRELGEEANHGRALTVLGRALAALGQADRSVACLRDAHEILSRLGDTGAEDVAALLRDAEATVAPHRHDEGGT